ncbi:MAG: GNAT family N-acetyltransferase [Acidobacteria bacterium]|nr:GNAT family N-acetyltransferase [Acidobacteriota bacterium]
MTSIRTRRLNLTLMPEEFLEASAAGQWIEAARMLGGTIPPEWWLERDLVALRLADLRSDARYQPWALRAMMHRESKVMVGFCGFHTMPNPPYLESWATEAVEFGYTVFPGFRNKGFATEAAQGLMRWASRQQGVKRFVVSISAANAPSAAVARKLGFTRVGVRMDPVDGLEEVYLSEAPRTGHGWRVLSLIGAAAGRRVRRTFAASE